MNACGDARLLGPLQTIGVFAIGDHDHDLRRQYAIADGVDQGLQIRTVARDEHGDLGCHVRFLAEL